jgi:hypothetical protein
MKEDGVVGWMEAQVASSRLEVIGVLSLRDDVALLNTTRPGAKRSLPPPAAAATGKAILLFCRSVSRAAPLNVSARLICDTSADPDQQRCRKQHQHIFGWTAAKSPEDGD